MKNKNVLYKIVLILVVLGMFNQKLFSQSTDDKSSLRYYLGQSKSFLYNTFSSCHITAKDSLSFTTLSVSCTDSYYKKDNIYIFKLKDGLVNTVIYMPNDESNYLGTKFSLETSLFKKEGWKITKQSTDENGGITYKYNKDNICVEYVYWPAIMLMVGICWD